ncbi:Uncharacterized protein Adt_39127 [Abeliophyllum distichum]|uniref:Uncharacterized protein n=1 Tax=Abeliophyllum distichum TaxID=126358 RepID=A0ABD1Q466_9LAMI
MLLCERISNTEALSALKRGLDTNHPFWRDVHNKIPATFDQLVEMITEEITNENMIFHINHKRMASNLMPGVGYGRGHDRHILSQYQHQKDYPSDPNTGISYGASAQEGLLPSHSFEELQAL